MATRLAQGDAAVAPVAASRTGALHRRALSLGSVNALGYALQFLLPVMLARFLAPEAFGEYRLIWLVIMTAMSFVPMEMPGVLYFFLPRAAAQERRLYVHQTWLYLAAAGGIAALAVSPWNPWLPESVRALGENGRLLPLLVFLYAATLLLDTLPTIDERLRWQAAATLSLSLLRALLLTAAAWLGGDLGLLLWLVVATLAVKALWLVAYVARHHGLGGAWFGREAFRRQFAHAAPFGMAEAFYQLRAQSGQWVAASLFPLGSFAAFSVATLLDPVVNICRQSVNHVFLPSMSRSHAAGDVAGMIRLNSRANVMVAMFLYPLLAFAFVFADDLIRLVFTAGYAAAAPVMRFFSLGLVVLLVEVSSLTLLYRDGGFVLRVNVLLVVVAAGASWLGAWAFGLPGAALGSPVALLVDRALTLRRIASHTGMPVRALQAWRRLAQLLAGSALAGGIAWFARPLAADFSLLWRLAAGGLLLLACYAVWLRCCRAWPEAWRGSEGG